MQLRRLCEHIFIDSEIEKGMKIDCTEQPLAVLCVSF